MGLEPTGILTDFMSDLQSDALSQLGYTVNLVPGAGFGPARRLPPVAFETTVSAISPSRQNQKLGLVPEIFKFI